MPKRQKYRFFFVNYAKTTYKLCHKIIMTLIKNAAVIFIFIIYNAIIYIILGYLSNGPL